jgi:hypothetical protein
MFLALLEWLLKRYKLPNLLLELGQRILSDWLLWICLLLWYNLGIAIQETDDVYVTWDNMQQTINPLTEKSYEKSRDKKL